jgi:hypothetical protein
LTIGFLLERRQECSGANVSVDHSEAFRHGIRAGAKVAFIPLLTDLPIVLVSGILFAKLSNVDLRTRCVIR